MRIASGDDELVPSGSLAPSVSSLASGATAVAQSSGADGNHLPAAAAVQRKEVEVGRASGGGSSEGYTPTLDTKGLSAVGGGRGNWASPMRHALAAGCSRWTIGRLGLGSGSAGRLGRSACARLPSPAPVMRRALVRGRVRHRTRLQGRFPDGPCTSRPLVGPNCGRRPLGRARVGPPPSEMWPRRGGSAPMALPVVAKPSWGLAGHDAREAGSDLDGFGNGPQRHPGSGNPGAEAPRGRLGQYRARARRHAPRGPA